MAESRRHHYAAEFYQRNFADPMFSNNIRVYEAATKTWNSQPRTPRGIGWFPHLYSFLNEQGERTDRFEDFLQRCIDGPAAAAMKVAARAPRDLQQKHRQAIATFIGFAAARTPAMMNSTLEDGLANLPLEETNELDAAARDLCVLAGKEWSASSQKEFVKPDLLAAIAAWAFSMRDRVLRWKWHFVTTTREHPFVTSDWPVWADHEEGDDVRFVSFPISSQAALLIHNHGTIRPGIDPVEGVRKINHQTMRRAREFLICHTDSFPGDELLTSWPWSNT